MAKQNRKPWPEPQEPGPGRSTAEAAFNEVRRAVAQQNEQTHQQARKIRAAREQELIRIRRERDY